MKKALLIAGLATCSFSIAQNVNIPDAAFKAVLVGNPSINTNSDAEIQVSEAIAYTGQIECSNQGISDLTGLEAFVNLTEFYCQNTSTVTSIDLSQNIALTDLRMGFCGLTSIDLSNNTALTIAHLYNNQLTSLDVSANTALQSLDCFANQLTTLDVTNNTALTGLQCYNNQLTSLDVTQNTLLTELRFYQNQIATIDLSQNTALITLNANSNQLSALDVSSNTSLTWLGCGYNQITSLDVSMCPSLNYLLASSNQLTSLNAANGNNNNFTTFKADLNSNLYCIEVDNPTYSSANWTDIDAGASFSTDCACVVNIPDANLKTYLLAHGNTVTGAGVSNIDLSGDGEIQCYEAETYMGKVYVNDGTISDLTGLESFENANNMEILYPAATTLDLSTCIGLDTLLLMANSLTSVTLPSASSELIWMQFQAPNASGVNLLAHPNLVFLYYESMATSVDVSSLANIESLTIKGGQITSFTLPTNAPDLWYVNCVGNDISTLDVSGLSGLIWLYCQDNSLTSLNVANGNNTNFTQFNATNNPSLTCIEVDDATYSTTNWTNIDAGASFSTDCSATSGMNEFAEQVSMYPNPASGMVYLQTSDQIKQISVIDIRGAVVLNTNSKIFSVAQLPSGFYVVHVITEHGNYQKELIVE